MSTNYNRIFTIVASTGPETYMVQATDVVLFADCTGGDVTFILPPAIQAFDVIYTFKKLDSSSNSMIVSTVGGQTIDGVGSMATATQNGTFVVISDKFNFYITTSYITGAAIDPFSLHIDGSNSPTANISWNNNRLTNLANPTSAQDAATKAYVDAAGTPSIHINGSNSPIADIDWNNNSITNLKTLQFGNYHNFSIFIGYLNAGNSVTTGQGNTALGVGAGGALTSGSSNTFLGRAAGGSTNVGTENVAVGFSAAGNGNIGNGNTFMGFQAGNISAGCNLNTLIGHQAGIATSGSSNVIIGADAANQVSTGSNNIVIGAGIQPLVNVSNQLLISNYINFNTVSAIINSGAASLAIQTASNPGQILLNTDGSTSLGRITASAQAVLKTPDNSVNDASTPFLFTIKSGDKTVGTGSGGNIDIKGGNNITGPTTIGGRVQLIGGNSNTAGTGFGVINIIAGTNTNTTTGSGNAISIQGGVTNGSGTGGGVLIASGRSTAGGPSGKISLRTGGATFAGIIRFTVDHPGNVVLGLDTTVDGTIPTNATDGFLYLASSLGVPTGIPTAVTGRNPLAYDRTNSILYAYNGAWIAISGANTALTNLTAAFQTPSTGVLTLTNGPGAASGNPAQYLTLNVNGTNYVIPAWTF